jgi:membrane protein DedA with SNARE-associated domain
MIKERGIFVGSMFLALVIGVVLASILAYLKGERINPASIRSYRQHHLSRAQETAKMLSEPSVEMAAGVTEQTTANLAERNER